MIASTLYYSPGEGVRQVLSADEVKHLLQRREGLLWLDTQGTSPEDARLLADAFRFHPLAIDDCLSTAIHPPKVDEFEDHIFVIVHGAKLDGGSAVAETTELCLFLGEHFVVTEHDLPLPIAAELRARCQEDGGPMRRGADFLAHALIDGVVGQFQPTVEGLALRGAELEEAVVDDPRPEQLREVSALRRSAVALLRVIAPQREVLHRLSLGDYPFVGKTARVYFSDVYDQLWRIEEEVLSLRELTESALNIYMSSISNRLSSVMKVLSIIATIFLPLSLVAGFFGMNFGYIPGLALRQGYLIALGIMVALALVMLYLFRRQRWL
ncbi:MAG: magnesium/cobalt transporter CorA [Chloroflexi bacterium]|nr:magnesium/cobalt transporter CorA [Chloroflexota bacterium]